MNYLHFALKAKTDQDLLDASIEAIQQMRLTMADNLDAMVYTLVRSDSRVSSVYGITPARAKAARYIINRLIQYAAEIFWELYPDQDCEVWDATQIFISKLAKGDPLNLNECKELGITDRQLATLAMICVMVFPVLKVPSLDKAFLQLNAAPFHELY